MPRKKLYILVPALLVCLMLTHCRSSSNADKRPNIVFILVDDMRWDDYGAGGHNYIKTPNIDRLAKEGASFVNAFAATPLCSPSRANFLTGQYAHTNGITDNLARDEQSHRLETFPKALQQAGYETAFIGKWHMGNDDSQRPGWDYWIAMKGQGEAIDPPLNINGEQTQTKGYVTDIFTDYSLSFIKKEREKPFLLYLSHKALHPNLFQADDGTATAIGKGGFVPAQRHKGMFKDSIFHRRPNNAIPPTDKPALLRQIGDLAPLGSETATKEESIQQRAEMLMAVDESLGEIMKALEENGKLENTIIVFTSDHGYWYGEHGLDEERRLAYEEAIRIPLLMRYPVVIKAEARLSQMVQSIDLAPTLLEMAGEIPGKHIEGRSLVPILNGTATSWRNSILIEYYSDTVFPRVFKMGYKAIRTGRYKYIHYLDLDGMDELYDLQADPFELQNQINNAEFSHTLDSLKAKLNDHLSGKNISAAD